MTSKALLALALIGCSATTEEPAPSASDPTGFVFESTAGSIASFGWSGQFQQVLQPLGTPFAVATTTCQGDQCRFTGPVDPHSKVNRFRCLYHMRTECTSDNDCVVEGNKHTPCVYIYDAPVSQPLFSIADGARGACAWTYIPLDEEITGSLNLTSGALKLDSFKVKLPLNASEPGKFAGVCMECVGDRTPNDGIRDGKCQKAGPLPMGFKADFARADDGQPCDVHRDGVMAGLQGHYSMDCSPSLSTIPGGDPLELGGSFTSAGQQVSVGDSSPKCTDGRPCFCGMCAGSDQACMAASDCDNGAACLNPQESECFAMPPDPTKAVPTQCTDKMRSPVYASGCEGACDWNDDTGTGRCKPRGGAPTDRINCYPADKVVIAGHSERDDHVGTVYRASMGRASCIPLGVSPLLNQQLGLPGLLYTKRNFQITPQYAEDKP